MSSYGANSKELDRRGNVARRNRSREPLPRAETRTEARGLETGGVGYLPPDALLQNPAFAWRWIYVLLTGLIHAFTLGPILNNGVVFALLPSTAAISMATTSSIQYILFLSASIILYVCGWVLVWSMSPVQLRMLREGAHWMDLHHFVITGLVLAAFGHGAIPMAGSLGNVIYAWMVLAGLGGGVAFWLSLKLTSECFGVSTSSGDTDSGSDSWVVFGREIPKVSLALGWVSVAPGVYTAVFPQVHKSACKPGMSAYTCMVKMQWSLMGILLGTALVYAVYWAAAAYYLNRNLGQEVRQKIDSERKQFYTSKETNQSKARVRDADRLRTSQRMNRIHLKLFFFATGCLLFQCSYYIPFVKLPEYMASPQDHRPTLVYSAAQRATTSTLLGVGTVAGRLAGSLTGSVSIDSVFFNQGLAAACCVLAFLLWILEAKGSNLNWSMLNAFVMIFGIFSGACYSLFKFSTYQFDILSDAGKGSGRNWMLFLYGGSLAIGATVSVIIVEVAKFEDRTIQFVCIGLAAGAAFCFLCSAAVVSPRVGQVATTVTRTVRQRAGSVSGSDRRRLLGNEPSSNEDDEEDG